MECAVREVGEETGLRLRNAPHEGGRAEARCTGVAGRRFCLPVTCPRPAAAAAAAARLTAAPCWLPHGAGALFSDGLAWPSPVSASDGIVRDDGGRLLYHYAIINLAGTLQVGT